MAVTTPSSAVPDLGSVAAARLAEKSQANVLPIESSGAGKEISVRAKVSGALPNSRATLEFYLVVANGKTVAWRIG